MYFKNVKTLEELRSQYKELLKKYHPDNGGSLESCQEVNAEYDLLFKKLKNSRVHYEDARQEERETKRWNFQDDEKLRNALYKIIHLEGLNIEIVGCWIWVDGETYKHKDKLKEYGYTYSRNRQKWHYSPYETAKYYKGKKKSFDELRSMYGSERYQAEKQEKLSS